MGINRDVGLTKEGFTAGKRLYRKDDRGLASILRGVLQKQAAVRVAAESITGLTDNSGGTAPGQVDPVVRPTEQDVSGGTNGATAASIEASLLTVADAYATLTERANLVTAEVNAGALGEGYGTAGAGTIAAIDVTVAANTNDTDSAEWFEVNRAFGQILDQQSTAIEAVNICRRAVGLSVEEVVQASGAGFEQGEILPGVDQPDTQETIGSSADAVSSVLASEVNAALVDLANNVAELADELDEATAPPTDTPLTHFADREFLPGRGSLNVTGPSNP